MDYTAYIKAILALVFVLGLIGLFSFLLKRVSSGQFAGKSKAAKRISLEEVFYVDAKRKLLLVKRDDVEHLILLGANSETVIENNITVKQSDSKGEK
ncbi:MAG: flagellar biosynthetic protein FliO [Rickettsiales bacterium]|nr:flagellar biosynthetic protein FliO [Pseudomonadota bacterium]MDA0965507.1 flagellar biosynthetic protein FliO [Pseudomonadota bacterium]MDG4542831.1 flagellar biosynthetic protein FliO [Rickettsiales bacterium]MDG4544721.1 flagellar biosynthetic protein FliO [Rickettsiales bacterium]MDG4546843.1 flagellar biosynthetic protein FliO [Rickettsiales bacterium]